MSQSKKNGEGLDWLGQAHLALHNRKRSKDSLSDDWETPQELFDYIVGEIGFTPELDVCAEYGNNKCPKFYSKEEDGLAHEWKIWNVFCNPPHSETGKWVKYANEQWRRNNINIVMLIPANTMSSIYFHKYVESDVRTTLHCRYFPLLGRIQFHKNGKPSEHKSRNAYIVVTFKKRTNGHILIGEKND